MTSFPVRPRSAAENGRRRVGWRAQWARRPPGAELWIGASLALVYVGAALSALVVYWGSWGTIATNPAWVPPFHPIGPSWAHPFGVVSGLGADVFRAVWQATPWDLAIVLAILAIDATLALSFGVVAGLSEGGWADALITFVSDSIGAIPSFFLVVAVYAGLTLLDPSQGNLPLFIALFGLLLWPTGARTVRERARVVAHEPYVEAARASGAGTAHLAYWHVLPNSVSPVLAQLPVDVAPIFFVLAVFPWFYNCGGGYLVPSTLGPDYFIPHLAPASPLPSVAFPEWGNLLAIGTCAGFSFPGGADYWWMYLFPLLAIVGLGLTISLLCDGIDQWRRLSV